MRPLRITSKLQDSRLKCSANSIALALLLTELRENPQIFTRAYFVERYSSSGRQQQGHKEKKPLAHYSHRGRMKNAAAFYPMADKGGTSNGRKAVNSLAKLDGRLNDASDYDMSEDSEVEY